MGNYRTLNSPSHDKVKYLITIRDGKDGNDLLFIEGSKIVETALSAGAQPEDIFMTENALARGRLLLRSFAYPEKRITLISERVSKKLSDTRTPQGIFATVRYHFGDFFEFRPRGVIPVIDRIQDPGNLGTIIRTADAFGMKNMILLEGTCSPANQKVIRSSAASIFNMTLAKASEKELIQWAEKNDLRLLVSDSAAPASLKDIAPGKKSLLILGNESSGVSDSLKSRAHTLFSIPLPGKAESLNVAVASAIILYEFSRKIKNP